MRKIIATLNSNWGLLLAFVPGINILYLIFRLLVVTNGASEMSVWAILPAFPIAFLYLIVPTSWYWLVTHAIISVIVFIVMKKSQGTYCYKFRTTIPFPAIICMLVFAFLLVNSLTNDSTDRLSRQAVPCVVQGLNAVVSGEAADWTTVVHPTEGKSIAELDCILTNLQQNRITLTKDFEFGRRSSGHQVSVEVDGEAVEIERYIIDGSNHYRLVAVYLSNEDGTGLISFDIFKT